METIVKAFAKLSVEIPGDLAALITEFDGQKEGEKLSPAFGKTIGGMWAHAKIQVRAECHAAAQPFFSCFVLVWGRSFAHVACMRACVIL